MADTPTIYEWAGGREAFSRWLNAFYDPRGGDQRLRFVTLLSVAADLAGLPADPEFRAAIMGYAEWGSRLAVGNSAPDAAPAPHAPVPRWGWGVAPPYQP